MVVRVKDMAVFQIRRWGLNVSVVSMVGFRRRGHCACADDYISYVIDRICRMRNANRKM